MCEVDSATDDNLVFERLTLGAVDDVDMSELTLGNDGWCGESALDAQLEEFYRSDVLLEEMNDSEASAVGRCV